MPVTKAPVGEERLLDRDDARDGGRTHGPPGLPQTTDIRMGETYAEVLEVYNP